MCPNCGRNLVHLGFVTNQDQSLYQCQGVQDCVEYMNVYKIKSPYVLGKEIT
jgi:hypothetical protein